jgi:hypothetical protein
MKLTIKKASWHRNGICGVGFYAIVFEDHEQKQTMIASLFDEPGFCAVYSINELSRENIEFAEGNSWRGDHYEAELRPLLNTFMDQHATANNRIGAFSSKMKF